MHINVFDIKETKNKDLLYFSCDRCNHNCNKIITSESQHCFVVDFINKNLQQQIIGINGEYCVTRFYLNMNSSRDFGALRYVYKNVKRQFEKEKQR